MNTSFPSTHPANDISFAASEPTALLTSVHTPVLPPPAGLSSTLKVVSERCDKIIPNSVAVFEPTLTATVKFSSFDSSPPEAVVPKSLV